MAPSWPLLLWVSAGGISAWLILLLWAEDVCDTLSPRDWIVGAVLVVMLGPLTYPTYLAIKTWR